MNVSKLKVKYPIRLGIVGARTFIDTIFFQEKINQWIETYGKPDLIVSGGAKGADTLAECYAKDNLIPINIYKPQYQNYPEYLKWKAPLDRNTQIVELSTHILSFPSHKGSGTQDTIKKAAKYENEEKKIITIHYID